MSKKLLSLFLALLMTFSVIACGSASESGNDTAPAGSEATSPEENEALKSGVPEGTTFEGANVRIINGAYYDKYWYMLNATETNGDNVNDAVYFRNAAVEDLLDITFEITNAQESNRTQYQVSDALRKDITAGDQNYDIYQGLQSYSYTYPLDGFVYDMQDSEYLTFDAPWWSSKWIEPAHLGSDKRYLLAGDISPAHIMQMCVVFYNKSLIEDYYGDGDMLYREVLDGKWTLDRLYELSSGIWDDADGNNKINSLDTVGIAVKADSFHIKHLFYDAGGRSTYYDDNGALQVIGLEEREADIIEKIYNLLWNNIGAFHADTESINTETQLPVNFANGNIAFMYNYLYTADHMRDMQDEYGIIPCPKANEEIENYAALIHNQTPVYCIPSVTSTADMACAVLEELAYQGYLTVIPQYYEVALKAKYMRDTQDEAMQVIDLIRSEAMTEPAFLFKLDMFNVSQSCIAGKNYNYASMHAISYELSVNELQKFKDFYLAD